MSGWWKADIRYAGKIDSGAVVHYTALQVTNGERVMQVSAHSALNVDVLALVADSVICTDEDGRILVFNQAAEQSFGYKASEVIGQLVEVLLPHSDRLAHVRQVRSFAFGEGDAHRLMGHRREVRGRRKNGEEFPAEAMVLRQTVDGRTILTVVHRDISERKELEELRATLGRELDHRMRNLLSVVNSLISLSAASAVTVEDFKESLTGRMRALTATQAVLLGKQQSASLRQLFLAELAQYRTRNGANVVIKVPPVAVGAKAAQMLALVIHELATNSAKYGALGSAGGRLSVTAAFNTEGDKGQLVITWREAGGPPVKPPKRQGFGTRLIEQVAARTLRADVAMDYRPEGLVCRMTLPRAAVDPDA